jgi:hypothetical protein
LSFSLEFDADPPSIGFAWSVEDVKDSSRASEG